MSGTNSATSGIVLGSILEPVSASLWREILGPFRDPPEPTGNASKNYKQRGGTAQRQGWRHWSWAKNLRIKYPAGRTTLAKLQDEPPSQVAPLRRMRTRG